MSTPIKKEEPAYLLYQGLFQKVRMHYFRKVVSKSALKKNSRLLDYGCGPGDMLLIAKEFGIDAYGIDNFQRSVDFARNRGLDVTLGDSSNMPYQEKFFDLIFCQSVIEHVPDTIKLVKDLTNYLKPGGTLILSSPTPGAHFWDDPTHIRPFTPKSFYTLADICELEVFEVSYVFAFLLGVKINNSIFYKLMNILPISLGSNIIGIFKYNK
jgi:SAM-dependent methyltransferase